MVPPDRDAELEDLRAECLGLVGVARTIGVVENQWMQVAIAGVKDVHAWQAEFLG